MPSVGEEVIGEGRDWDRFEGRLISYGMGEPHGVPADHAVVTLTTATRRHYDGGYDEFKTGTTVQVPVEILSSKTKVEKAARENIDHVAEAVRCTENAESALQSAETSGETESIGWGVIAQSWATLALAARTAEQTALVREGGHLGAPTRDMVV